MKTYLYIAVAAVVTYLIRAVPLVFLHGKIESRFLRSFLYYVPYATLASLTFPAILYGTGSMVSAVIGFAVAVLLSLKGKNLMIVAISACAAVFVTELLMSAIPF